MTVAILDLGKATRNPLHPLGHDVRQYLLQELHRAANDANVSSIILTGGTAHFSSGADLTEFSNMSGMQQPSLLDVIAFIDNTTSKPIVAAVAGACLGGGLELALACHYRICSASAQLGLPEVQVGVIPGAGGTQRLPRLVGLQKALQMILTGQAVSGEGAKKMGLVDAVVANPNDLLPTAVKWAQWAELMPLEDRRLSRKSVDMPVVQAHVLLRAASLELPKPNMGGQGLHAAVTAIQASLQPFDVGLKVENEQFLNVLTSAQGQARRHAFFAVRQAQKAVAKPPASHVLLQKDVRSVQVAVIGAGTMGSGIALTLLQVGFTVWLVDNNDASLQRGMAFLRSTIDSHTKRGKVKAAKAKQMLKSLRSTIDLKDLSQCQLVVEAVIENLKIKQSIFKTLASVTPESAILVSNTSTLDMDQMASVLSPARQCLFAGWHFFSPAHVMKLVEIVVGAKTALETVALLQVLSKRIGKIAVVVGNCDGFVGNRMLKPYQAETVALLTEGVPLEQVDQAILDVGMALGPFQLSDLAGNDVGYNIRRERGWVRENKSDPVPPARPARYTELADDMVSMLGRAGQKVGKGWYDYDPAVGKGRKGLHSPEMHKLIQSYVTVSKPRKLKNKQIVERVLYPLVNEGFKCLEEQIARCPSDIDVVYIYGYGFPAWRGGPMYWADHEIGLDVLLRTLQALSRQFPGTEHYVPSKLLEQCVQLDLKVEEYYQKGLHKKAQSKL